MQLFGTYAATVEAVNDPARLGRVKARVPAIHGVQGLAAGFIGTNDMQWAFPVGLPAGGSARSGGFSHLPRIGDHVWIRFLDGEPEKPIWEWGCQDQDQIVALPLNRYNARSGQPEDRSAWTRFGHTAEISDDSVLITTNTGYALQLFAGDTGGTNGFALLSTPRGHQLNMDDDGQSLTINCVEDFYLNVPDQLVVLSRSQDISSTEGITLTIGTDLTANVSSNVENTADANVLVNAGVDLALSAGANLSMAAQALMDLTYTTLRLGGEASTEPFVKGTQLSTFLNSLLLYLSTHTHGNGNNGSPTTPPIIPPQAQVQPQVATLVSTTIFGS